MKIPLQDLMRNFTNSLFFIVIASVIAVMQNLLYINVEPKKQRKINGCLFLVSCNRNTFQYLNGINKIICSELWTEN